MKWKITLVVVVVLLVAALGLVSKFAFEDKNLKETRKRIRIYRVIEEEQRLTLDILKYKIEIAKIQAQFAPKDVNDS